MAQLIKGMRKKMRYKTRKLIFSALAAVATAALISLLLTCTPLGPPDDYEEYEDVYTDVEYSEDGSTVTIYLDGSAPVRQSRAITKTLAILGHDLFEVSFYHPATNTFARAVWETGHAAGISGVARNVNYRDSFLNGQTGANGAAILFVGKKSDRTLLAVGKLAMVDDKPLYSYNETTGVETPITPVPLITSETKTVTFAVAALKAGVSATAAASSFKTDSGVAGENTWGINDDGSNTTVYNVMIGTRPFPLFQMPATPNNSRYMHGAYKFNVVTNTTGTNTDFESYYRRGIIQKAIPAVAGGGDLVVRYPTAVVPTGNPPVNRTYYRIPRYPIGNDQYQTVLHNVIITYEGVDENGTPPHTGTSGTRVQSRIITAPGAAYAASPGDPFHNQLGFLIGPNRSAMEGYVFAFSFEVPVYPLTGLDGRGDGFSWYLRPGYDPYQLDLDDGVGGPGGAILIGTGEFEQTASANLYLYKPPSKIKYNGSGANPWNFSLDDIDVWLKIGPSNDPVSLSDLHFVIKNARLTGTGGPIPGNTDISLKTNANIQTLLAANNVGGKVTIVVEYYGPPVNVNGTDPFIEASPTNPAYYVRNPGYNGDPNPTIYITEFNIYYFNLPSGINFNIPDNQRFTITNSEDFNRVQAALNAATVDGTYLIAFFHDFNVGAMALSAGRNFVIVIVAGNPDIVIGKSGTNVFNNNNGTSYYYMGVWPFDEILAVQGKAFDSQEFYINPGGTYQQVPRNTDGKPSGAAPPQDAGYFIYGGGTKNTYSAGVTIFNEAARLVGP
jgi:hypothetical protein